MADFFWAGSELAWEGVGDKLAGGCLLVFPTAGTLHHPSMGSKPGSETLGVTNSISITNCMGRHLRATKKSGLAVSCVLCTQREGAHPEAPTRGNDRCTRRQDRESSGKLWQSSADRKCQWRALKHPQFLRQKKLVQIWMTLVIFQHYPVKKLIASRPYLLHLFWDMHKGTWPMKLLSRYTLHFLDLTSTWQNVLCTQRSNQIKTGGKIKTVFWEGKREKSMHEI